MRQAKDARRARQPLDRLEFLRPAQLQLQKSVYASEQDRPDVVAARDRWRILQKLLDPARLVFINETGTSTNMARIRGRCRRGERLVSKVPHGHWKITTFVAGLRHDAICAPFVIDKPMNSAIFRTYLEQCLVPTLKPGDIVVMDNLSSHKSQEVRTKPSSRQHVQYFSTRHTPPTSIRSSRRSPSSESAQAAERSIRRWNRISAIIDVFSADECHRLCVVSNQKESNHRCRLRSQEHRDRG